MVPFGGGASPTHTSSAWGWPPSPVYTTGGVKGLRISIAAIRCDWSRDYEVVLVKELTAVVLVM